MAHRCHDAVCASVEGPLDHPFLCVGNADNGASTFGANGIVELDLISILVTTKERSKVQSCKLNFRGMRTYLVVVVVRNQSMLSINQNPAKLRGTS